MMINLDVSSLEMPSDETYSVWNGAKVKVFRSGVELGRCIYCNVTRGVAICIKEDLQGKMVVADGEIIYDLRFGLMTVEPVVNDFDEMGERINQKRRLNGRAT